MENQSFTYVNPSAAGSTLTDNHSQLLAYLRQQHSMTSSDSGSHSEIRAGIPTMDDCHVAASPLNQIQFQQITSTIARLSHEQNSSLETHTEIPMDLQQATSRPTLISMSQLMAQRNSVPLTGSGFNLGLGLRDEIPMDQLHVQQTTTVPMLTLIPVSQLMAQQSGSGPNLGLGVEMMSMGRPTSIGGETMDPEGSPDMGLPPHFNEADQPHQARMEMDRIMMECQDYIGRNRGSFFGLVYPAAPGPFHEIFMMEDHEQRQFLEEIQREEVLVQQEATRQKAFWVSTIDYLLSVPNLSHEDRDRFMTMCPPVSSVELDLFMRLRTNVDEIYRKIQQLEGEAAQKIADSEAIRNYVMLFINDRADFMAQEANTMQVNDSVTCSAEDNSDTGSEDGSETGAVADYTGSEDGSETGAVADYIGSEDGSETGAVAGSEAGSETMAELPQMPPPNYQVPVTQQLYIEIPRLEDGDVILANAAEDWAEDAEYPEINPFYGEEN